MFRPWRGWRLSRAWRLLRGWHPWPWLMLTILLGVTAAAGCRHDTTAEDDEATREATRKALADKKKEAEKPPFQLETLNVRPSETDRIGAYVKPGHWTTAALAARANRDDFRGELVTEMLAADGSPAVLDGIPAHLVCSRPVILPKGQPRSLGVDLFLPVSAPGRQVGVHLLAGPGGRDVTDSPREGVFPMPAHQYYFVVLARGPDKYRFLQSLDSVRAPAGEADENIRESHYRVLLPAIKTDVPLPSQSQYWTTIAYVLWDDLEPSLLSSDQRQAMLDWLHWGGQIIVSGPDSLDILRGSFLEPYLPVSGGVAWPIDKQVLADLNRQWPSPSHELTIAKPWSGQKLKQGSPGTTELLLDSGGEPLVVERRAGAGRVVVTAFRLSQRELIDWPGFDGFFNGCLLRRGKRRFGATPDLKVAVNWLDGDRYDPRLTTRLRYFTRDADAKTGTVVRNDGLKEDWQGQAGLGGSSMSMGQPMPGGLGWTGATAETFGMGPPAGAGVAGWNDNSPVSELARQSLREAAGIEVPKSSFVLAILGAYVVVLVPLNWFVFSRLGRVEWAWIAAPLVAIGFGLLVVWLAQVNIGFARSATEVSVLEVQGGYGRGHLTRYTALYSSLSTSYDLSLADPSAVALPMAARSDPDFKQSSSTVSLRRFPVAESSEESEEIAVTLEGFQVSSNSTGMVHSEQMLELGGAIELESLSSDRCRVHNGTRYTLRGAGLVSDHATGWIGTIEPGQTATVELRRRKYTSANFPEWESSEVTARAPTPGGLNVRPLLQLACDHIAEGQTRLVAWTDEEMPGLSVRPGAAQLHAATLVVAHLDYDPEALPRPDANARADFPNSLIEEEALPVEPAVKEPETNTP